MKAYKGNIIFTKDASDFTIYEDSYILVEDGKVKDIVKEEPDCEVEDFGEKLIIPAFNDIHIHAPQFTNSGIGYDEELIPWLNKYTFPTEAKYADPEFARKIYKRFIEILWRYGSMRSVVFSSLHKEGTEILFDLFKESGLGAYIGKVNMDRNSTEDLIETTEDSLKDTREIIEKYRDEKLVKPIITPRFVPSCTNELMEGLQEIINEEKLPVQSHLSENVGEVEWVKELHPDSENYGSVYDKYDMFGTTPTIQAHCVYCTEEEMKMMEKQDVYVAHCPTSNLNLMSGLAPIKEYLERDIKVGLGTDVAGGHTFNMMQVITSAIHVSKMYWLYVDKNKSPLTTSEAFYIATKGGGEFFGNVGSFEKDYAFDALVIDDSDLKDLDIPVKERLEKVSYMGEDKHIIKRFVEGNLIEKPFN